MAAPGSGIEARGRFPGRPAVGSFMAYFLNSFVLQKAVITTPAFLTSTKPFSYLASFASSHWIAVGCVVKAAPVALLARETARLSGPRGKGDDYGPSVSAGLVLSALGDVYLHLSEKNENMFLAGLGSFLLGHLMYIRGFASLGSVTNWPVAGGPFWCYRRIRFAWITYKLKPRRCLWIVLWRSL